MVVGQKCIYLLVKLDVPAISSPSWDERDGCSAGLTAVPKLASPSSTSPSLIVCRKPASAHRSMTSVSTCSIATCQALKWYPSSQISLH
jgi:hypothetical protein